ncbi:MAG: hypothetical protein ACYT04_70905 [Nostoc sp.]
MFQVKQDLHGSCFSQGETLREQVGIAAQRTALAMQLPRGTRKVNAWGESHL